MDVSDYAVDNSSHTLALLGPTNTGKTFNALEQMLSFETGCIGFPLRLLAREAYDKVVRQTNPHHVALVTGEEKIIPAQAKYFLCTVESMPIEQKFEFLAVDEIQLCAAPERGHIFTDRLLRARGTEMTMFMGAGTMSPVIRALVPNCEIEYKTRFSTLSYAGHRKMSRLPRRTAVVAFSIDDVYTMAELIRRQRGGTAVVLGALSPRARNRQVEMYQSGEVDFMVATDAIGMGLNMDINQVALASLHKYDGKRRRPLTLAEIGQIAGRAGRYKKDGTFGVTADVASLDQEAVDAIENHNFPSVKKISWRNSKLHFQNINALIQSLEAPSPHPMLQKGRPADDYNTLCRMRHREDVMKRLTSPIALKMLWEICQIPDFRKTMTDSHYDLVAQVFTNLMDRGYVPDDIIERSLRRLQNEQGDVDTLMNRIAHIRTWTYITHKNEWLKRGESWSQTARKIEDQLSDALHNALTKRFVDRRSAFLLKAMANDTELLGGIKNDGSVIIEGHRVGQLDGFRFIADDAANHAEKKLLVSSARKILKPEVKRRCLALLNAENSQFSLSAEGEILYQEKINNPVPGKAIAKLSKGRTPILPDVKLVDSPLLETQDKSAIQEKLETWIKAHVATVLEVLLPLTEGDDLQGAAKGIAFQLFESMGIVRRKDIDSLIADLTTEDRRALRSRKVILGPVLVFMPALNKPAAIHLRGLLWRLWHDAPLPAPIPPDGATSVPLTHWKEKGETPDPDFLQAIGYPVYGPRAIRIDMLDRVISAIFDGAEKGVFQAKHEMAEWLGCSIPDLYAVLEAMGHRKMNDPAEDQPDSTEKAAGEAPKKEDEEKEKAKEEQEAEPKTEEPSTENAGTGTETAPENGAASEAENKDTEKMSGTPPKPELATFRLYRSGQRNKKGRTEKTEGFKGKSSSTHDKKGKHKKHGKKGKPQGERQARVISVGPDKKDESNPFSILESMKDKMGK